VAAHLVEKMSIRKVATRFSVSNSLVQQLIKQQRSEGSLQPKPRGKPQLSHLTNAETEVRTLVAEYPDATLLELCELFAIKTGHWVSRTALCRYLQKLGLHRKKNMVQSPSRDRKSRKIKIRVLGKNPRYRARKSGIFG
jgi:putative transposase